MANDLLKIVEQSKALWGQLGRGKRIVVLAAAAIGLVGVAYLGLQRPTESYATLFAGLQAEDAGRVLESLKAQNAPYRLEANGTTIQVPSARVHELRLSLAQAGLPKGGGVGFEVFDKQMFGTTSFVEQMNYRRALQGELQRSIASLEAVERARVHIAIRERSLFRNEDEPPSASVVLSLRPGRSLGPGQVRGIVHLVSSAVEGLRQENISIVDESGLVLWSGDLPAQTFDRSHELERRLQRRVSELIERVVGQGKAQVAVTVDLDATKNERTEEVYDKDRAALRSEQKSEESAGSSDGGGTGGIVGAKGNLPGAPAPKGVPEIAKGHLRSTEARTFEITKTTTRTTQPELKIRRMHVAVLVDEAPDPRQPGAFAQRTKEELEHLTALAIQAAGIEIDRGDKIEVRCVPFGERTLSVAVTETSPLLPADPRVRLAVLIGMGVIGLMLIVGIVLLAVRRTRRRHRALIPEILPRLPASVGRLESMLGGETSDVDSTALTAPSARDRAQAAAKRDAARAARVLSAWLKETTPANDKATATPAQAPGAHR